MAPKIPIPRKGKLVFLVPDSLADICFIEISLG